MAPKEEPFCAVSAAIGILQEKWVLPIVRALLEGPRGFNELGRTAGGCNPTTLSQRLEQLEALGIVEKTVQSYMPPRTLYSLTASGVALQSVIDAIETWGKTYLAPDPETGTAHCLTRDAATGGETERRVAPE
jgi:DNA-binding HxlR family transcriptional regulator